MAEKLEFPILEYGVKKIPAMVGENTEFHFNKGRSGKWYACVHVEGVRLFAFPPKGKETPSFECHPYVKGVADEADMTGDGIEIRFRTNAKGTKYAAIELSIPQADGTAKKVLKYAFVPKAREPQAPTEAAVSAPKGPSQNAKGLSALAEKFRA